MSEERHSEVVETLQVILWLCKRAGYEHTNAVDAVRMLDKEHRENQRRMYDEAMKDEGQ